MKIWVVMVGYKKGYAAKVSQEAYRTIEEAQQFCESRDTKKITELFYEDNNNMYMITDVTIKE